MMPARRQLEVAAHELADLVVVDCGRVRRCRSAPTPARRRRSRKRAEPCSVRQTRGDDVLRDVARHIAGGAIDLGGILAGERAAAVRRRAAVGVDDDLAAGDAGIAVRPADDEPAGRIDEDACVLVASCARE